MAATPHGTPLDLADIVRLAHAKLQRDRGSQTQAQIAEQQRLAHEAALADVRAQFTARLDGIIARLQSSVADIAMTIAKEGDSRTYTMLGASVTLRYYDPPARVTSVAPGKIIKITGAVAIPRRARGVASGHVRRLWDPALGEAGLHVLFVGPPGDTSGSWLACTLDEQRFAVQRAPLARVILSSSDELCATVEGRHGVGRHTVDLHDFLDGDFMGLLAEILA